MTSDIPNKILPNSFQTPNFFVDECMHLLTGNEFKCLSFIARKTFGWQKRSDRIAKSQIVAATGLGHLSVDKAMNSLVAFGLVIRVANNNTRNLGNEWALQTDDHLVRFDLLAARQAEQAETNHKRTAKARLKSAETEPEDDAQIETDQGGGPVPQGGPVGQGEYVGQQGGTPVGQEGGGPVRQTPQKPIKTKEKMGASAPGSPAEKTDPGNIAPNVGANAPETSGETSDPIQARIDAFPEATRETVRLMLELFGVRPPERPAPNEKGGDFALWLKGSRELIKLCAEYNVPLEKALRLTCQRWQDKPFDVSHPGALKKSLTSILAQNTRSQSQSESLAAPADEPPASLPTLPGPELQARIDAIRKRGKTEK
jgi:phage replication O-like protein O